MGQQLSGAEQGHLPGNCRQLCQPVFLGITAGRALCGFLTLKLNDAQMVRMGIGLIAMGVVLLLLPLGETAALAGLLLVGFGCAPIYPS